MTNRHSECFVSFSGFRDAESHRFSTLSANWSQEGCVTSICMAPMRPPRLRPCAGVLSVGERGPSSCGAHGLTGMLFPPQASPQTWELGATNVEIVYVSTGGGARQPFNSWGFGRSQDSLQVSSTSITLRINCFPVTLSPNSGHINVTSD